MEVQEVGMEVQEELLQANPHGPTHITILLVIYIKIHIHKDIKGEKIMEVEIIILAIISVMNYSYFLRTLTLRRHVLLLC